MSITRRTLLLAVPPLLPLPAAWAQADYPNRPIRIVCPFAAGAATDVLVRRLSESVGKTLGQPIVIENRPGAQGAIAARIVAKAPADGYTLMIAGNSSHAANVHTMKDAGYDPVKDFTPITHLTSNPQILVVNAELPVRNVQEFIKYAKERPGKLSYGVGNAGSLVAASLLKAQAGIDAVGVNYPGTPQATTDLLAGRLDFIMNDPVVAVPHVQSGKLRVLAVTSRQRLASLPDVAPLAELGLRDFDYASWSAVVGPAGLPAQAVDKVHQAFTRAMAEPAIQKFAADAGIIPVSSSTEDFRRFLLEQIRLWGIWSKQAGLTPT
jgi:tripartite-type tricarboxylate transporter receptor subunit TctC